MGETLRNHRVSQQRGRTPAAIALIVLAILSINTATIGRLLAETSFSGFAQPGRPPIQAGPNSQSAMPGVSATERIPACAIDGPALAAPASVATAPTMPAQAEFSDRQRFGVGIGQYAGSAAYDGQIFNLKDVLLEANDLSFSISFASALQLADARPLIVSADKHWVAEAQLQRAKVIKIPEFDFGMCMCDTMVTAPTSIHGVNQPTFTPGVGGPLNQNLNFMYLGGSVFGQIPLTEAVFNHWPPAGALMRGGTASRRPKTTLC